MVANRNIKEKKCLKLFFVLLSVVYYSTVSYYVLIGKLPLVFLITMVILINGVNIIRGASKLDNFFRDFDKLKARLENLKNEDQKDEL